MLLKRVIYQIKEKLTFQLHTLKVSKSTSKKYQWPFCYSQWE